MHVTNHFVEAEARRPGDEASACIGGILLEHGILFEYGVLSKK